MRAGKRAWARVRGLRARRLGVLSLAIAALAHQQRAASFSVLFSQAHVFGTSRMPAFPKPHPRFYEGEGDDLMGKEEVDEKALAVSMGLADVSERPRRENGDSSDSSHSQVVLEEDKQAPWPKDLFGSDPDPGSEEDPFGPGVPSKTREMYRRRMDSLVRELESMRLSDPERRGEDSATDDFLLVRDPEALEAHRKLKLEKERRRERENRPLEERIGESVARDLGNGNRTTALDKHSPLEGPGTLASYGEEDETDPYDEKTAFETYINPENHPELTEPNSEDLQIAQGLWVHEPYSRQRHPNRNIRPYYSMYVKGRKVTGIYDRQVTGIYKERTSGRLWFRGYLLNKAKSVPPMCLTWERIEDNAKAQTAIWDQYRSSKSPSKLDRIDSLKGSKAKILNVDRYCWMRVSRYQFENQLKHIVGKSGSVDLVSTHSKGGIPLNRDVIRADPAEIPWLDKHAIESSVDTKIIELHRGFSSKFSADSSRKILFNRKLTGTGNKTKGPRTNIDADERVGKNNNFHRTQFRMEDENRASEKDSGLSQQSFRTTISEKALDPGKVVSWTPILKTNLTCRAKVLG